MTETTGPLYDSQTGQLLVSASPAPAASPPPGVPTSSTAPSTTGPAPVTTSTAPPAPVPAPTPAPAAPAAPAAAFDASALVAQVLAGLAPVLAQQQTQINAALAAASTANQAPVQAPLTGIPSGVARARGEFVEFTTTDPHTQQAVRGCGLVREVLETRDEAGNVVSRWTRIAPVSSDYYLVDDLGILPG